MCVSISPGTAVLRPSYVNGELLPRSILPIALTFDHRAMDGEPVGRFITAFAAALASPSLLEGTTL
jgi:pyruvate dehydrogenase E2 component (dihydrolipoamide acetyltransferase)